MAPESSLEERVKSLEGFLGEVIEAIDDLDTKLDKLVVQVRALRLVQLYHEEYGYEEHQGAKVGGV